jgi:hypothetical protein
MLAIHVLGFVPETVVVHVDAPGIQRVDIALRRTPVKLAAVRIEGRLRDVPPRFADVYRRMSQANGKFFTGENIDQLNPIDVEGILLRTPTIHVNAQGIFFPPAAGIPSRRNNRKSCVRSRRARSRRSRSTAAARAFRRSSSKMPAP